MISDTVLLLLFPVLLCLPVAIMGFVSKWRDEQADKEEARQKQALA